MPIKQQDRLLAIKTALGPDVLGVRAASIQEQISRLFEIGVELSSEDGQIDFDKIIGQPATLRLNVGQSEKRYFNGIVSRVVQVANRGGFAHYHATLVPWLWFLTRTSDCRIFQEKSAPDIIEEVFKGHGFDDYQLKLSATYAKRQYCVQYRETDFNFVSRLMEEEGIYYFFHHEDGKHSLVLADSISAHKPAPGYAEVLFKELETGAPQREVIIDWTVQKELQPVACALNDFDFKKPKASLLSSANVSRKYAKAQFEIYDYPGDYVDHAEGQRLADVRINELQCQYELLQGRATSRGLAPGAIFKLKGHPRADQNRDYLVTDVSLNIDAGEFATTPGAKSGNEFFTCTFTAIDKSQQFRPPRLTPKPVVQGPQTAMVVGPSGETIHTDQLGRVKVQFHWDRHAKGDDNASCWIRVSQPWGGKNWGGMFIPHVGQEVIIMFEEGDPDRPLISGRVYNPDQMPPVPLPAGKTQSAIRDHGGNQTIMEGMAGIQFIHTSQTCGNEFLMDGTTGKNKIDAKQKCGNEFLMDGTSGSEKIKIKDKYGNEVCLDAVKGTLRLYSPTHKSELVLGKSIEGSSESDISLFSTKDFLKDFTGQELTKIHGPQHENILMLHSKFIGGLKHETIVGGDIKLGHAYKIEKLHGPTLCESPVYKIESKTVSIDGEHVCYIGNLGHKSQIKIAPAEIVLLCGDSSLKLTKGGTITIAGKKIVITGENDAAIQTKKLTLTADNHDVQIGKEDHS